MTWAISKRTFSLKKLKIYSLRSCSQKISLWLSELFPDLLTKTISTNSERKFCETWYSKKNIYILGDFNINYTGCKNNTLVSATISNDVKNYLQFCIMFGLTQIIKSPTRIACRRTSLIDHILASLPEKLSQEGVRNVDL